MTIYAADGSTNVTLVDGTERTGIYANDGSFNVVEVDGTTYTGTYAPCGAMNICFSEDGSFGVVHPCGALNVSSDPYVAGTHKVTVLNPPI